MAASQEWKRFWKETRQETGNFIINPAKVQQVCHGTEGDRLLGDVVWTVIRSCRSPQTFIFWLPIGLQAFLSNNQCLWSHAKILDVSSDQVMGRKGAIKNAILEAWTLKDIPGRWHCGKQYLPLMAGQGAGRILNYFLSLPFFPLSAFLLFFRPSLFSPINVLSFYHLSIIYLQ